MVRWQTAWGLEESHCFSCVECQIESFQLIEVIGDKNRFDAVIIGNRDEEYENIFQVYAPSMSSKLQKTLERTLRKYLKSEFRDIFSIVFVKKS